MGGAVDPFIGSSELVFMRDDKSMIPEVAELAVGDWLMVGHPIGKWGSVVLCLS